MAQINGSILPFTRDAAFINHRAQARRDAGENFQALRLFRRAMRAAPENAAYAVDTAELLNHMGCARASYELLNSLINDGRFPPVALFGQACNLASQGWARGALSLLRQLRSHPIDEEFAHDVEDMQTHLMAEELLRTFRLRRNRLIRRMNECSDAHDAPRACAVARRYLRRHADDPLAHAAMAWAQAMRGDQAASMEHLVRALAMKRQDPWVLSMAARMLDGGVRGQARPALENAYALSADPYCDRTLLRQACVLGMDALVLDISGRLLETGDCDPHASACRAAAMINLGEAPRAAMGILRRCLEVYPGDATATYYAQLIEHASAEDGPLAYPVEAMPREWARTVAGLRIKLLGSDNAGLAGDERLMRLLEWGLYCQSGDISISSIALLAHIGGDAAREALWRFLASYERPQGKLYTALSLMSEAGIPLPRAVFTKGRLRQLTSARLGRIASDGQECLAVRAAARRLRKYPYAALELSAMLFFAPGLDAGAHLMTSALECAYRMAHGEHISLRAVACRRHLNCARLTRVVYALIHTYHPQEEPQ